MHSQAPKLETKTKWPIVVFALSNQNDVEQQKENAKNQNTLKATPIWLQFWQKLATEKKVSEKLEDYEHEQLDNHRSIFASMLTIQ